MDIIEGMGDMLRNEELLGRMKVRGEEIKEKRVKVRRGIVEGMDDKVVMMMEDRKVMGKEVMRKGVKYRIKEWKWVTNMVKEGCAEIWKKVCEERMKGVKVVVKKCMKIGSEDGGGKWGLMFCVIERWKVNEIDGED